MNSAKIKKLVEDEFNIRDISTESRIRHIVFTRYVYIALCFKHTEESSTEIGKTLGRDHSTILHGKNQFDGLLDQNIFDNHMKRYIRLDKYLRDKYINEVIIKKETSEDMEQKYKHRLWCIIQKNHSVINKMRDRISELENKLSELV